MSRSKSVRMREDENAEQPCPAVASDAAPTPATAHDRTTLTAPALDATAPSSAYFSFKDFLSEAEAAQFFQLPHNAQVDKVTQYLDFLGQQPAAAHFTTSSKASISFAATRESRSVERLAGAASWRVVTTADGDEQDDDPDDDATMLLKELLAGRTRSGFGAFGTDDGFLPQKQLSLAVAAIIEEICHEYVVERTKRGEIRPPVLNSRSFFFYWCHAEKQKLLDIRHKLDAAGLGRLGKRRRDLWHRIVVVVDRAMCLDCIQFATCFARSEQIYLAVEDPEAMRVFPPDAARSVELIALK